MSIRCATQLAVKGGQPVRPASKPWPTWPVYDDRERNALIQVLESGKWFLDARLATFEREYAAFQGVKYCVAVCNGTAAIEILLEACGVGPGDEVIVPPYTFYSTASAPMRLGATVVFADVNETWNLDPDCFEAAITPRTKAVIPVHFGSAVADMDRINTIAAKHGIHVIEDACHSWGSQWKGKGTGALGRGGAFSFQLSKNITAGEGGAITTDDETFGDLCRSRSNCGRRKDGPWYEHAFPGTNARMSEFHAALLSAQLTRLEAQIALRERNAAILNEALGAIEGITPQPGDPRMTRRSYHLYGMRIDPDRFGCPRDRVVEAAKAEGLPCGSGYLHPLYKQPVFQSMRGPIDYSKVHCPMAENLCYRSVIWFGHPLLLGTEQDMRDIIDIFSKIKENAAELAA